MNPLRIVSGLNVSKEVILNNIRNNLKNRWLDKRLGSGSLCVVGGGPSLKRNIETIKRLNMDVMALNNAHDYLIQNNIIPKYAVLLDARDDNVNFYKNPHKDVTYLLASQVSLKVFEALEGHEVYLWHVGSDETKKYCNEHGIKHYLEINGGCTVGLRSLYLSFAIGYTDLHLFGFDSSFEDYHHAYKQELNDSQDVIEVMVEGESFKTSPTMAKQAYQFQSVSLMLVRGGAEITVYGSGLLPKIHMEMQKPVDPNNLEAVEARKYSNMWAIDDYRKISPGEGKVNEALVALNMKQGSSIIDFGCGTGRAAQKFKDMGFNVLGVDHAGNCLDENIDIDFTISNLWNLPDLEYDYGFCTDVMEHIPTSKVDDVLKNIKKSVKSVYFQICTVQDGFGDLIGDELHLTVKPLEWWVEKLSQYWRVSIVGGDSCNISLVGES